MKIVVVGGVAGGASFAARARRLHEKAEIILLQAGPDVSFASCGMPYFVGGEITDRSAMAVQTPASLAARFNLDVRVNTTVTAIDTNARTVTCTCSSSSGEGEPSSSSYTLNYDELVLAVGASPLKPPIPGIDRPGLFALRNLQDMDAIVDWMHKQKASSCCPDQSKMHCVVAGAGFIGLEMVEQLYERGCQVTVVEMLNQILGPLDPEMAAILHADLQQKEGVRVIVNDGIKEFLPADPKDPDNNTSTILKLASGQKLPPSQLTILGLGVRPDTAVIQKTGTIQCTPRGHIVVDDYLHTSADHVWAVGDAVEINNPVLPGTKWAVPLAGPANRQGRMVADNILSDKKRQYKGTYGVSVVRSFDLYAATVGVNEKFLKSQNIANYATVHIHPNSHAGYYPGASKIHLKLIFDKITGKLYGAQAVGKDGVEKRIDVIATAMQGELTVSDLAELELCYAPPVGSAKDPVNFAGMVAQNVMDGLVDMVQWHEVDQFGSDDDGTVILDVRGPGEIETSSGSVAANFVNIPLNDLRKRINELPKDKRIVVTCATGQRAYYACRILKQYGFDQVASLDGSFATFQPFRSLQN